MYDMKAAIIFTWVINAIVLMFWLDIDSFIIAFFTSMFGSLVFFPIVAIEVYFVNRIMDYFIEIAENAERI